MKNQLKYLVLLPLIIISFFVESRAQEKQEAEVKPQHKVLQKKIDSLEVSLLELKENFIDKEQQFFRQTVENANNQISYFFDVLKLVGIVFTVITTLLMIYGWNSVKQNTNKFLESTIAKKNEEFESRFERKLEQQLIFIEDRFKRKIDKRLSLIEEKFEKELTNRLNIIEEEVRINKAVSELFDQAHKHHKDNDYKNEIIQYHKILDIDKENVKAMSFLGYALVQDEEYLKAISCLNNAIEIDKEDPKLFLNLGTAYGYMKIFDEEEKSYRSALKLDKNYSQAFYNIACSYTLQERDLDDIIGNLSKALKINPELKNSALLDPDFESIREEKRFKELLA